MHIIVITGKSQRRPVYIWAKAAAATTGVQIRIRKGQTAVQPLSVIPVQSRPEARKATGIANTNARRVQGLTGARTSELPKPIRKLATTSAADHAKNIQVAWEPGIGKGRKPLYRAKSKLPRA